MRKVCIVTGTRAEYGLLRWVLEGVRASPKLELQLLVTGMHLSPEFGLTYRTIEADGFRIDRKIESLLSSDTPVGLSKAMGLGLIGFADVFAEVRPDVVVLLGDRFEIFAVAAAAMVARIPIAHIHGGEATEGLIDEPIRHSVTKMSHIHFAAADEYRQRIIQLGEDPSRVFQVGGVGIDNIMRLPLLDREALEESINFRLGAKNLLITFHPVTLEDETSTSQMRELLAALAKLEDTSLVFTMPNADTDGRELLNQINRFAAERPWCCVHTSLGQVRYLSCLKHMDGVVGNSSSGLLEAPSFRIGTVNIGDRQRNRLKAESVIDCEPKQEAITAALATLYSSDFQTHLRTVRNPYGEGGASDRIVSILESVDLSGILKKRFYDAPKNS